MSELQNIFINTYNNAATDKNLRKLLQHYFNAKHVVLTWNIYQNYWHVSDSNNYVLYEEPNKNLFLDTPYKYHFINSIIFIDKEIPQEFIFYIQTFINKIRYEDLLRRHKLVQSITLSNISHCVRTPINGILHLTQDITNEQINNIEHLNKAVMTLANNMFDILDQTKVELNRIVLNPCIINFKQLIKSVLDIISENIPYNIDDSVPKYIYNDPHRIKQILIILIKNSLQQSVNDVYLLASSIIVNDNLNNMSEYQHNIKITIKNNHKYDNTNIIFAPLIVNCDGDPNLRVSYLLAKLLNGYVELKETCFEFSFITPEDEPIEYSNKTLTKLRGKTAIIIGKLPTLIKILDLYEIKYIIVDSYEEYNILYLDSKPDIIIDTINPVTTILTDVDKKIYINKHMSDIEIKVAIRSVIKDNNDIYNKKIMVVEDEIINRIVIEKILKKIGYTNIILINNGIKALKAYDTSIDLLLIDIRMPGMSGFELSNAIHQINPSAKMIGITAQTVSETELKPWFKDFVYKPINTQDLKNKINHLLI